MKVPHFIVLIAFLLNSLGPVPTSQAQEIRLPSPGMMVQLSPEYNPPVLKGVTVYPNNPFKFDFILDKGDQSSRHPERGEGSQQEQLKSETSKLVKYFLASITTPENDLWVNLSPYEKNRIIPQSFGQTDMGRDLLAEDYILKQITASLIYPEGQIGKQFWLRVYQEAKKKFGTTDIPVNTFNKVWIVPDKAKVYEHGNTAYVVKANLKVMLEQDYLSLEKHTNVILSEAKDLNNTNALGSQIVREIVIPELTREVNEGKNFAVLRQVYYSMILATWFKKRMKNSILGHKYMDQNKVTGIHYDHSLIKASSVVLSEAKDLNDIDAIYQRYLRAFKKGVYNYIKEETDPITQEMIPRKYFSGGVVAAFQDKDDLAMTTKITRSELPSGNNFAQAVVNLDNSQMVQSISQAMLTVEEAKQSTLVQKIELDHVTTYRLRKPDGEEYNVRISSDKLTEKEDLAYRLAELIGANTPRAGLLNQPIVDALRGIPGVAIAPGIHVALYVQPVDLMTEKDLRQKEGSGLEEIIVLNQLLRYTGLQTTRGNNAKILEIGGEERFIESDFDHFDYDKDIGDDGSNEYLYVSKWTEAIFDVDIKHLLAVLKKVPSLADQLDKEIELGIWPDLNYPKIWLLDHMKDISRILLIGLRQFKDVKGSPFLAAKDRKVKKLNELIEALEAASNRQQAAGASPAVRSVESIVKDYGKDYQTMVNSSLIRENRELRDVVEKMDDMTAERLCLEIIKEFPDKELRDLTVEQLVSRPEMLQAIWGNLMIPYRTVVNLIEMGELSDLNEIPSFKGSFAKMVALHYMQEHFNKGAEQAMNASVHIVDAAKLREIKDNLEVKHVSVLPDSFFDGYVKLGSGTVGIVYKDKMDSNRYYKVMGERNASYGIQEITVLKALSGVSGVPKVIDWGNLQDGRFWIHMEGIEDSVSIQEPVVDGGISKLWGKLTSVEHLDKIIEVAEILLAVHKRGISQNDLKPANIVFNKKGEIMIIDWNIATAFRQRKAEGSRMYSPPEMTAHDQTDVYSLGLTMDVILEKHIVRRVFDALRRKILSKISKVDDVDGDLQRLRNRMKKKDFHERPSMEEVVKALRELAQRAKGIPATGSEQPNTAMNVVNPNQAMMAERGLDATGHVRQELRFEDPVAVDPYSPEYQRYIAYVPRGAYASQWVSMLHYITYKHNRFFVFKVKNREMGELYFHVSINTESVSTYTNEELKKAARVVAQARVDAENFLPWRIESGFDRFSYIVGARIIDSQNVMESGVELGIPVGASSLFEPLLRAIRAGNAENVDEIRKYIAIGFVHELVHSERNEVLALISPFTETISQMAEFILNLDIKSGAFGQQAGAYFENYFKIKPFDMNHHVYEQGLYQALLTIGFTLAKVNSEYRERFVEDRAYRFQNVLKELINREFSPKEYAYVKKHALLPFLNSRTGTAVLSKYIESIISDPQGAPLFDQANAAMTAKKARLFYIAAVAAIVMAVKYEYSFISAIEKEQQIKNAQEVQKKLLAEPEIDMLNIVTNKHVKSKRVSERMAVIEREDGKYWTSMVVKEDCVVAVVIDKNNRMSMAHFFNIDNSTRDFQVYHYLKSLSKWPKYVTLFGDYSGILKDTSREFRSYGIQVDEHKVDLNSSDGFFFGIRKLQTGNWQGIAAREKAFPGESSFLTHLVFNTELSDRLVSDHFVIDNSQAMTSAKHDQAMNRIKSKLTPGGIDLTTKRMNLEVDSDKAAVSQPMNLKMLDNIEINGLYIKDIKIKPLNDLPKFLGVSTN